MIYWTVASTFVITSLFILKYPTLLHKKKKIKFKARHISHRGGLGERMENTMAAFEHAHEVGSDMFELDCRLTKDGHVVVSHDNVLGRCTGVEVLISETVYKDLPKLKHELMTFSDVLPPAVKCVDQSIPLLRDVFERFPDVAMNIEVKVNSDELIEKVSTLVTEFGREEITVWGNETAHVTDKCYRQNRDINLFFSRTRIMLVMALFYSGLLPFYPLRESFFVVPLPTTSHWSGMQKYRYSWLTRLMHRIEDFLLMSKTLFRHLQARGMQVYLFVLNDEQEWQRAFDLGVDGVMTDRPTALQQFISTYPWPAQSQHSPLTSDAAH